MNGTSHEPDLTIACLVHSSSLREACSQWLAQGHYQLVSIDPCLDPIKVLDKRREDFDAVLLEVGALQPSCYHSLHQRGLLWPAVVIGEVTGQVEFHDAEVHLPPDQLEQLSYNLDAAVSRYLRKGLLGGQATSAGVSSPTPDGWMLSSRIKGRLGYLGVFYKRDPSRFLRQLPPNERHELLMSLTRTYRDLLMSYFRDPAAANQALESYVNTAFFSDLPISNTVEIHMDLIESLSKQLKFEGHPSNFLQDYRLALLDVMAHLCEMYRRSIPNNPPTPASTKGETKTSYSKEVT